MSADGEVEVSVRAEGVEDAAGEMGGDALAETAGGGGAAAGGGAGGAGRFGRVLAKIAGLVAFLGPILDVLKVFANIGKAFIAPLAILLFRLFQPLAVGLLKVLPVWFDIFDGINAFLAKMDALEQTTFGVVTAAILIIKAVDAAKSKLTELLSWGDNLIGEVQNLPARIWSFVKQLPGQIATSLSSLIPGTGGGGGILPDFGGGGGDTGDGILSDIRDALGGGGDGGDGRNERPIINFQGGLGALIERGDLDPNVNPFG